MSQSSLTESAAERVSTVQSKIEESLSTVVAAREPTVLYEPVQYVLDGGGKRVRPTILLLVANAFGRSAHEALPAALAIEVFHNFTLVHDDIMDEADERRGRPAVHKKWDVGTAILTGDVMMGLSYDLLGQVDCVPADRLYDVYHPMVEQLCAGQALDASFEGPEEVSVDAYLEMIDGKTAALLSAAFELGAVVGEASDTAQGRLREAGALVGRAFQIQDDLLDLTATNEDWGKAIGGDLVAGKKTYLTLRALERAEGEEYRWFARLLTEDGLPASDVEEARDRMERLDVLEEAQAAVQEYSSQARDHFQVLPDGSAKASLQWLIRQMEARGH